MNEMLSIWFFGSLVLIVIETINPGLFYFLSISCGGFAATLAAWFHEPIDLQVAVFVVTSIISATALRLILTQMSSHLENRTNIHTFAGREAVVVQEIYPHKKGYIRIDGEWWPAQEEDNVYVAKYVVVEVAYVTEGNVVVQINKKNRI